MEKQTGKKLLKKLRDGNISPEELQLLESWYVDFTSSQVPFDDAPVFLKDMEILDKAFPFEIEKQPARAAAYKLLPRIAIAAAVVVIISGIGLFYYNFLYGEKNGQVKGLYVNDIDPGEIGATLTLANGKKIKLAEVTDGLIAKEAGLNVSKTADGQLIYEIESSGADPNGTNTLSTEKGETYIVTLPDKSKVWLNAASSLTYPAGLNEHGLRKVRLEGEAYFEIARDKLRPFIVQTARQQVEVLGTHFNVNSYSNEPVVKTTLLEGSVKVSNGKSTSILKPNQQSILNYDSINIKNVNAEDEVSWKDGVFLFQDETLESIMRRISRWYNVDVVFTDGVNKNQQYGGGVSRYSSVSVVLEMLESTKDIHFKIEGRRIFVMK